MRLASVLSVGAALVAGLLVLAPASEAERAAFHYVPVQARVVSARIEEGSRHTRWGTYPVWTPRIRWQYDHAGFVRTSERLRWGDPAERSLAGAQAILDRFPPGKELTAWVDPDDPDRAVLERQSRWAFWLPEMALGGLVVGLLGLALLPPVTLVAGARALPAPRR